MAKAKLIYYPQKRLKDGTCPIILQVIHERKVKRISTGYACRDEQWNDEACRFRKNFEGYKTKNQALRKLEEKAETIIDTFTAQEKPFTFNQFEEQFRMTSKGVTVYGFLEEIIDELDQKGRMGNKQVYKDTMHALKRFSQGRLMLPDIDYTFLKKWEASLFKDGCSGGGISVYMRTLRAAYNEAIRQGLVPEGLYPFSSRTNKNGYSVAGLKSKNNPRALSLEDIEKIKNFPLEKHPELADSVNYFLFSYYARGINFTDMAKLKKKDLYDSRIHYIRSKNGRPYSIKVSGPMLDILEWFAADVEDSPYLLPILSEFHVTPKQQKYRIQKCIKKYNQDLKEIAKILGINVTLTSYVARHTYATTLKRKGVETSVISEAMGHKDAATTMAYLKQFEDDVIDRADQLL